MNRQTETRLAKPMLERLEGRDLPAFLLNGTALPLLAQPLTNMVTDMQAAQADLKAQFLNLQNNTLPPPGSFNGAEQVLGKMIGDWQRILNDSAAIKSLSNADMAFLHNVAFAEFQNGDVIDLAVLLFGPSIGFDPTHVLTDPVNQANSILTDATLTNIVGLNLHTVRNTVDSTIPISQETVAPTF